MGDIPPTEMAAWLRVGVINKAVQIQSQRQEELTRHKKNLPVSGGSGAMAQITDPWEERRHSQWQESLGPEGHRGFSVWQPRYSADDSKPSWN